MIRLIAPLIRIFARLHESLANKHMMLMQCLSSDSVNGGSAERNYFQRTKSSPLRREHFTQILICDQAAGRCDGIG